MSDELEPEVEESGAPAPPPAGAAEGGGAPLEPPSPTLEEIAAVNDAEVQRELHRLSRRGFITFGASAAAMYAGWKWLRWRPKEGMVEWPLRRGFQFNEKVAEAYFRDSRLT